MPKPSQPKRHQRKAAAGTASSRTKEFKHSLRGLGIFLQQTTSFRLALALYNDPIERDKLIVSLREELAVASRELIVLDLLSPSLQTTLLGRIEERLSQRKDPRQFVVMVINLESSVEYNPELASDGQGTKFLATANLHRESFAKVCPTPMVLWMTELLERAFMHQAPDLWHWRSHVFDLRTRHKPDLPTASIQGRSILADDDRLHPETRLELLEEELAAYRKAGSPADEMRLLNAIGNARLDIGDAKLARQDFEAVLQLAKRFGNRSWEGVAWGNLGNVNSDLGDARKAIEFYEKHLLIAREIDDRRGENQALGGLGNAYFVLGDTNKAIEFYKQQLVIAHEIGDLRNVSTALASLGNAYLALNETHKAIEFFEQTLRIARKMGDRRVEGKILGNLGIAHSTLGDAHKAIEFYDQQIVIAREVGDRRSEGNALWNSALTLNLQGERTAAIPRAHAAQTVLTAINDPNALKVRAELAEWGVMECS